MTDPQNATVVATLPSSSNILSAGVQALSIDGKPTATLFTTTADRRLSLLDVPGSSLKTSWTTLQDSPILSCVVFAEKYLLVSSMSGQIVLADASGKVLEKRRDHMKYVVQIATSDDDGRSMIATAGWDNKINIYSPSSTDPPQLGEPTATITLPTKPESILFITHPETQQKVMLLSRTDSTHLYYYTIESEPRLLGRQNLAPHSNAWVAFTPSAIALSPIDSSLVAVATSAVPSMKLLIVRLLIPPWGTNASASSASAPALRTSLLDDSPTVTETQASQARAALVIADKEHAAISIHCTTLAPQTAYSTPAVAWRPDGTGVWVNGDDGAIRGVEANSGKILATLAGHEPGSKVRCLWAGKVGEEEWLVSGGFDQKLIVWKA